MVVGIAVNFNEDCKNHQALKFLSEIVADDLKKVNQLIVKRMYSDVALIHQLTSHIVASGGKRLRPMLTLAAARMCGYKGEKHCELAAIIELIHTATLLHDDVIDESGLRRGDISANALWGNQFSVLVGDFLFSRAFELMIEYGSLTALGILSHASAELAESEIRQLTAAHNIKTDESTYLRIITGKTASLFAAACQLGAVAAKRSKIEQQALKTYGLNLGVAFQLVDDVLDYSAKQENLGKSIGDDFREGKITMPVILAFRHASENERTFWHHTLKEQKKSNKDLVQAIDLMNKHNAFNNSLEHARHFGSLAKDALHIFNDTPEKKALYSVADFCIERTF